MDQTNNQNENLDNKKTWEAPVLETCNIEQTMNTTGSATDGPSTTP